MKKQILMFMMLSFIIGLVGCSQKNSSNILEITNSDRKIILEYLETKTDDISSLHNGNNMVSAFQLPGTDKNKVYIWAFKAEYDIFQNEITYAGNGVSLPVVLNLRRDGDELKIISHKYPRDGTRWSKDVKKLSPSNVIGLFSNVDRTILTDIAENRADEILS